MVSRSGKQNSTGNANNFEKTGHRSRDCCERRKGKGRGEHKGKGEYTKSEHGYTKAA